MVINEGDDVTVNGVVTDTRYLESQGIICIHIPPFGTDDYHWIKATSINTLRPKVIVGAEDMRKGS